MNNRNLSISDSSIDTTKWSDLLKCSPFSNPFHSIQYYEAVNRVSQFEALAFAIQSPYGEYKALAVTTIQKEKGFKSWLSQRAIIYGGILLSPDSSTDDLRMLLIFIENKIHRKAIYIEIRNLFNYQFYNEVFKSEGWEYLPYLNIKIKLPSSDLNQAVKSFSYNRRREIRLTQSEGLAYDQVTDESDIVEIYKILQDLYRTRVGLPIPPIEFFIELWKANLMIAFRVTDSGTIVAGSFCPYLPGKAIYTFYYCGIRNYKKNTWPTHLAVLAAIEFGIKEGLEYLDFMGGGIGSENMGIRKYKLEFGANLTEEGRFLKINRPILYAIAKLAINIHKRVTTSNGIR